MLMDFRTSNTKYLAPRGGFRNEVKVGGGVIDVGFGLRSVCRKGEVEKKEDEGWSLGIFLNGLDLGQRSPLRLSLERAFRKKYRGMI